jgi:hypothetical protein
VIGDHVALREAVAFLQSDVGESDERPAHVGADGVSPFHDPAEAAVAHRVRGVQLVDGVEVLPHVHPLKERANQFPVRIDL